MTKTEKALAGIRCCLGPIERCDECPYLVKALDADQEFNFEECRQALRNDALEVIQKNSKEGGKP